MKEGIDDRALCGGSRAFAANRRAGRTNPVDRRRFLERIKRALDADGHSSMVPLNREFEGRVVELTGVRPCVAVCDATVGLQLLAGDPGTGAEPGDEVIVPAPTFPATAHAVAGPGLRPVFCDVGPVTGLIDPAHLRDMLSPRTRAIAGRPGLSGDDVETVCDIARLAVAPDPQIVRRRTGHAPGARD